MDLMLLKMVVRVSAFSPRVLLSRSTRQWKTWESRYIEVYIRLKVGRVGNGKLKHRPQIGEMDEMKGRVESESESDGARTSWGDQIT